MFAPKQYQTARTISSPSFLAFAFRPRSLGDVQPQRHPTLTSVRHATHGAQGRANGPKNGPGKRLGAKKTGDERVVAGNIIFRQRGTNWYPGENCGMGRDHTIFAREGGFVKYYRDPRLSTKRRYIGVVFDKTQTLPTPPNAVRRRRLNMVAVSRLDLARKRAEEEGVGEVMTAVPGAWEGDAGADVGTLEGTGAAADGQIPVVEVAQARGLTRNEVREARREKATGRVPPEELTLRPGYMYRESNYQIGRAAERAGVQVKMFERGDRFLAWRRKTARKARNAEKRALGGKKGSQKKGKKK